jgi:hypothetical protein
MCHINSWQGHISVYFFKNVENGFYEAEEHK